MLFRSSVERDQMAQVFTRRANKIARLSIFVGIPIVFALLCTAWWYYTRSNWIRDVGPAHAVVQPGGGYSHQLHVGGLKMDCRYCHTSVEVSSFANIPPTETCMGCHSQVLPQSPKLEFIRSSYAENKPVQWNKVHDLPKFVYFNHSIHVAKGIGCASCHGDVANMPAVYQQNTLQMEWCLSCHRNPTPNIRPSSEIFNTAWNPADITADQQKEVDGKIKTLRSTQLLTSCSTCHR